MKRILIGLSLLLPTTIFANYLSDHVSIQNKSSTALILQGEKIKPIPPGWTVWLKPGTFPPQSVTIGWRPDPSSSSFLQLITVTWSPDLSFTHKIAYGNPCPQGCPCSASACPSIKIQSNGTAQPVIVDK